MLTAVVVLTGLFLALLLAVGYLIMPMEAVLYPIGRWAEPVFWAFLAASGARLYLIWKHA